MPESPSPTATADEWDQRYSSLADQLPDMAPSAALIREVGDLAAGTALEIGCGLGADAVWLASRGWRVTALDVSQVALDRATQRSREAGVEITWHCGRLEDMPLPPNGFDLATAHYPALRHSPGHDAERAVLAAVAPGGTLLVVQPSFAEVGWPALLPVGVALNFALFMLVTRQIAKHTDPISLQTVSGFIAVVILLPLLGLGQTLALPALGWQVPDANAWMLLIAIGVLGSVAHLLMTWSLRYAPSATLAPMQYLEIPVATLVGLIVFGDLPNALAALGMGITMAAGLYIILRERATQRRLAAAAIVQPAE